MSSIVAFLYVKFISYLSANFGFLFVSFSGKQELKLPDFKRSYPFIQFQQSMAIGELWRMREYIITEDFKMDKCIYGENTILLYVMLYC